MPTTNRGCCEVSVRSRRPEVRSGRRLVSSVTYRKGILNEIRYSRKRKSSSRMAR
jgi:hypothetical protein